MSNTLRSVNTKFWNDPFVEDLNPSEKLLFLYLLTNPLCTLIGIYEITYKRISYDTGLNVETIRKGFERFNNDKKAFFEENFVILPNFLKNQNLNTNMKVAVSKQFNDLPEWLRIKILGDKAEKISNDSKGFERVRNGLVMVRKVEVEVEREIEREIEIEKEDEVEYKKENKNILMSELAASDHLNDFEEIALSFWELSKANMQELNINSTDLKKSKYKNWVDPIRLAMEKDERTTDEFRELFKFLSTEIPHNGFSWRANIRSGNSLREKFEQVLTAARNPKVKKSNLTVYENIKRTLEAERQ